MDRSPRILVVDDEKDVQLVISQMLAARGYIVDCVSSAEEGFDSIAENAVDVVFVDLALPGMSGLEMIDGLRKRGDEIPAVMISGRKDGELLRMLDEAGAVGLLPKPFRMAELIESVETALGEKA